MESQMIHHHYPLQAHLYLVALHRHLLWRLRVTAPSIIWAATPTSSCAECPARVSSARAQHRGGLSKPLHGSGFWLDRLLHEGGR